MADGPKYRQEENTFSKNRLKPTTFFNPEIDPDPDRKPTFQQKKTIPTQTDFQKSIPLGSTQFHWLIAL
jgi:hypothetical protein